MVLDGLQGHAVLLIVLGLALVLAAYTTLCIVESRRRTRTTKLDDPYWQYKRLY